MKIWEVVIICNICMSIPCHPRCPNHEDNVLCLCDECGNEIYHGGEYWTDDDGFIYCSERCAEKHNGIRCRLDDEQ